MKKLIYLLFAFTLILFIGCDDVLSRPELTKPNDKTYWKTETDIRHYVNEYYPQYFVGYNNGWGTQYAPLRGYNFADDFASTGKQSSFENSIPSSRGATSLGQSWLPQYSGPTWNFAWIKKTNILIERLENVTKSNVSDEVYKHWKAVAHFFRGFEYTRLVNVFGDVPLYLETFTEIDKTQMWKDRNNRTEIMEAVYNDLKYAFENMRENDGDQYLNKYIAAAYISRLMLNEGTWIIYHGGNKDNAKKYLEFAKDAGDYVIDSGKYAISGDFKSLFARKDLKGHRGVLLYRFYDAAKGVTHCIASYSNGYEAQTAAANLDLAKAFICNDGKTFQNSSVKEAMKLDIQSTILTRDPRFEATFLDHPKVQASTLLYASKFIDRKGPTFWNSGNIPPEYASITNPNNYPVMRYAEVLLNWIEAKVELANFGGAAVTQSDIDKSINALRNRDLDEIAIQKGIKKTSPLIIAEITTDFDPNRDVDVSPLMWEIRRERRMEFVFEHTRLLDLKRWKKLHYMDNTKNPVTMLGLWINIEREIPSLLKKGLKVMSTDGTIIEYNGSNSNEMIGFYVPDNSKPRDQFTDRSYLSPVGQAQIDQYKDHGSNLTQTKGW